ncbi:MAG: hypothetical protein LBM75_02845 [Myxococcales bacterium]|jgi:hypothetical protein|nr:hypothetical protein [Myxococcales bacterium]
MTVASLNIVLSQLQEALARMHPSQTDRSGRALLAPFALPEGAVIRGAFEVRNARGEVRRLQDVVLPLPNPLFRSFCLAAPIDFVRIETPLGRVTLWPPSELIELQVGYRWHGFNGKPLREWDDRFVVFAEEDGDPIALRLDEDNGPVWSAPRGEGRYEFIERASSLAAFYEELMDK